jgi:hypothetical protein
MTTALFIATLLTGLALLFSKNERLEECYESLPEVER